LKCWNAWWSTEEDLLSHSNASGAKWAGHGRSPIPVTEKRCGASFCHALLLRFPLNIPILCFRFYMSVRCIHISGLLHSFRCEFIFRMYAETRRFDLRRLILSRPLGSFMWGEYVTLSSPFFFYVWLSSPCPCSVCNPSRLVVHGAVLVPEMINVFEQLVPEWTSS
jgi:hypothetical protein